MAKKKIAKVKKSKFAKQVEQVQKVGKRWGYKSPRENATFCNGYFKGWTDALRKFGMVQEL